MKFTLLFILAITVNSLSGQSSAEVLANYTKEFSKPQYMSYSLKYVLYKGKNSNEILESYNGVFRKSKKNDVYIKVQNNELISNKNMCITISNGEKAIFVEKPKPYSSGEFDIAALLPYFKMAPMEVQGGLFKINLVSTPASGLPYNKIEVFINKKYQVVKQVFYFSTAYNIADASKPNYIYPRLVIENSNYKYDLISESVFASETYINVKGKSLSAKLKQYKVYDKRVRQ